MIRLTSTLIFIIAVLCASAQRTTRPGLKLKPEPHGDEYVVDSTATAIKALSISGYEKAQASSTESFFVFNGSDQTIKRINLTITYYDQHQNELHKRCETIVCDIAPGQRQAINIKSWDKQRLWHYKLTQGKHNAHSTPYDISMHINWLGYKAIDVP